MSETRQTSSQEYWIEEFKKRNAFWMHDGNPKRPHALLTSGDKHSGGFFNGGLVIADADFTFEGCCHGLKAMLAHKELNALREAEHIRVMGPAMGAVGLAAMFAVSLTSFLPSVSWGYFEKQGEGANKRMTIPRADIQSHETILIIEDTITTGSSAILGKRAVEEAGASVFPYLIALVNRSGQASINGHEIFSLVDIPLPTWAREDCPLCKQGSQAIKCKGRDNWARLNAEY